MSIGVALSTLAATLDKIDKKYPLVDKIFLAKNRVGNLTVFVNDTALGYIELSSGKYEEWPNSDWQYHLDDHRY